MVITVITLITHASRDASSALASPSQVQLLAQQHPITTAPRWWLHLRWSLQPKSDGNEGRPTGADAGGMGGWRGIDGLQRCHPITAQPLPLGCVLPGGSGQPAGGTTLQLPSLSRRADAGHPHRSHTASAISNRPASQRGLFTPFRTRAANGDAVYAGPGMPPRDPQGRPATRSADPALCRVARLRCLCVSTAAIYPVGPG